MENTNTKWFAGGLGLVMIMMLFAMASGIRTNHAGKTLEDILTVSMPRPLKEFILGFSLDGRNVLREVEGSLVGKTVDAKKPSPTKAQVDKGQNNAKTPQQVAAERARAQINEQRRREFQARVIEQAERYRQSLAAARAIEGKQQYNTDDVPVAAKPKSNPGATSNENKEEEKKMTAAEWKSLILSQPTKANLQKMMTALGQNEIELETYLEITEALIKDNSQAKKELGLMALNATYNQQAFTLASHMVAQSDAATQKSLNDYMYNYNYKNIGVFGGVLKGSDALAAAAAAQAITLAIQTINQNNSNNTSSETVRAVRGGASTTSNTVSQLSLKSYAALVPTLRIVVSKNLNNLSQWAQNLLSQLQVTSTTA